MTIQEILRASAAISIPETDRGMTFANVRSAMQVHHALHREAADKIDRLQAALKASDDLLLKYDRYAGYVPNPHEFRIVEAARSRKEP